MADNYVDMELDDDTTADMVSSFPGMQPRGPQYPYGLRICLDGQSLAKHKFDHADFRVGGILHLHAFARVTSVSEDPPRVELQITELKIESEDAEDEAGEGGEGGD